MDFSTSLIPKESALFCSISIDIQILRVQGSEGQKYAPTSLRYCVANESCQARFASCGSSDGAPRRSDMSLETPQEAQQPRRLKPCPRKASACNDYIALFDWFIFCSTHILSIVHSTIAKPWAEIVLVYFSLRFRYRTRDGLVGSQRKASSANAEEARSYSS